MRFRVSSLRVTRSANRMTSPGGSTPIAVIFIRVKSVPAQETCSSCNASLGVLDIDPLSVVRCPECGEHTTVGRELNRFALTDIQFRSTSGVVYRARDLDLGRDV